MFFTNWLTPTNVIQVSASGNFGPFVNWTNISAAVTADGNVASFSATTVTAGGGPSSSIVTNFLRYYFSTSGLIPSDKLLTGFQVRYTASISVSGGLSSSQNRLISTNKWDQANNSQVLGAAQQKTVSLSTALATLTAASDTEHGAVGFLFSPISAVALTADAFDGVSGVGLLVGVRFNDSTAIVDVSCNLDAVEIQLAATAVTYSEWFPRGEFYGYNPYSTQAWSTSSNVSGTPPIAWVCAKNAFRSHGISPGAIVSGLSTSATHTEFLAGNTWNTDVGFVINDPRVHIQGLEVRYARGTPTTPTETGKIVTEEVSFVSANLSSHSIELRGVPVCGGGNWPVINDQSAVNTSFATAGSPTDLWGLATADVSAGMFLQPSFGIALRARASGYTIPLNAEVRALAFRVYYSLIIPFEVNSEYEHEIQSVGLTQKHNINIQSSEYEHEIASVSFPKDVGIQSSEYEHEIASVSFPKDVGIQSSEYEHEIKSVSLRNFPRGNAFFIKRVRQL